MIVFSCFFFPQKLGDALFDVLLSCLPVHMRAEVRRCYRWEDRQNRLFGRLLIRDLLCSEGYGPQVLDQVYPDRAGKLFLEDAVDFNLSHSDSLVLAAITRCGRIGVDVEKKTGLKPENLALALRPDELELLRQEGKDEVYNLWTKKESLVKAKGQGLTINLKNIYLDINNRATLRTRGISEIWYFQPLALHSDYTAVLCTSQLLQDAVFLPAQDLIDRAIRYAGIDISCLPAINMEPC